MDGSERQTTSQMSVQYIIMRERNVSGRGRFVWVKRECWKRENWQVLWEVARKSEASELWRDTRMSLCYIIHLVYTVLYITLHINISSHVDKCFLFKSDLVPQKFGMESTGFLFYFQEEYSISSL